MIVQAASTSSARANRLASPCKRVEQQPLVGLGHHAAEFALEAEIEIGLPQLHAGVGHFGLKVQVECLRPAALE